MEEKGLLLVAVRVDDDREVQYRIKTVLSVAATYDKPPDTTAAVWCKPLSELVAADFDRLAGFIGWDRVRDLNVGDVRAYRALEEIANMPTPGWQRAQSLARSVIEPSTEGGRCLTNPSSPSVRPDETKEE